MLSNIATVVIAAANVVLVVVTGLMVWANRKLVAETKRLADASRDELFDAHRPVIFPSGKLPLPGSQRIVTRQPLVTSSRGIAVLGGRQ